MNARITAIAGYLPAGRLTNSQLAEEFPEWTADKIRDKTGIRERRISAEGEFASDLAAEAVKRLLDATGAERSTVDQLIVCTQTPDYLLPSTACIVHERAGLPVTTGSFDINMGCSGYVYGLSLAKGLVQSGQAGKVILVTSDTYTKLLGRLDKNTRAIFGDGATATLVTGSASGGAEVTDVEFGTWGKGADNLIMRGAGVRSFVQHNSETLYMQGNAVFTFTLSRIPDAVTRFLTKRGLAIADIDLFVFHQANAFMLESLRAKIGIPSDKFVLAMEDVGNTVSSSIPFALSKVAAEGRLKEGGLALLVGFGVGYSWGIALLRCHSSLGFGNIDS